jgi:ribonuclease Z
LDFEVQILGSNSAIAAHDRHPTCQIVRHGSRYFMIDCGEGSQFQMAKFKSKVFKIDHIFISHLHGDHYFGLIGLITTLNLLGRNTPLHIYASPLLKEILEIQLKAGDARRNYDIIYHDTAPIYTKIFEDERLEIFTFPLKHRIDCTGFIFKEINNKRKINSESLAGRHLSGLQYKALQDGEDVTLDDGMVLHNAIYTLPPLPHKRYAYCSDTIYDESIVQYIDGVDMLYHEATFLHERVQRATDTFHSTALQAGQIASKACAKKMLIGHFSSSYPSTEPFLQEAKTVFDNTYIAVEGNTYGV